jgi:hypothetical protein
MVPDAFRSARALRAFNTVAVGFSLAAVTAAVFPQIFRGEPNVAFAVGLPTALFGMLWAQVLRRRPRVGAPERLHPGWVAAIPLALGNGAASASLLAGSTWGGFGNYAVGALAGATLGGIFWVPALVLTLVLLGPPIARSQRLAKQGLSGEDLGERNIGLSCAILSLVGLVGAPFIPADYVADPQVSVPTNFRFSGAQLVVTPNAWVVVALGVVGAVAGIAAVWLARAREARRRRFVAAALEGKVAGYRVDDTAQGKVLVRVAEGAGYRVADVEEEVFELDAEGRAVRHARAE